MSYYVIEVGYDVDGRQTRRYLATREGDETRTMRAASIRVMGVCATREDAEALAAELANEAAWLEPRRLRAADVDLS
jgi:hypothetical protein